MNYLFAIAFGLLVAGAIQPSQANEMSLIRAAASDFDGLSRQGRIEKARRLVKVVDAIKGGLPLLKPSEAEWIAKEKGEIDKLGDDNPARGPRYFQLFVSGEFRHQELEKSLQDMSNALGCVLDDKVLLRREVFCWAALSYLLADDDLGGHMLIAKDKGRLSLGGLVSKSQSIETLPSILNQMGYSIGTGVVLPYLRGDEFTK